jgi:hypothetical protein
VAPPATRAADARRGASGNGFLAAFIGGLAFGASGKRQGARLVPFAEAQADPLTWLAGPPGHRIDT